MNCKPGEMAVTFGAPLDNGILVDVVSAFGHIPGHGHCWNVESLGSPFHIDPGVFSHTAVWPDRLLRPMGPRAPAAPGAKILALPVLGEVIA